MEFKHTVFILYPIFLTGQIFQLKQEALALNKTDPRISSEILGNQLTAIALNNKVMYGLVVVGYKYLIQVQKSELIIERVIIDRSQTRLKEFFNS
jgi:hypothetical protein